MSDDRPLVSVVMANFNYARFLPDALDSVRAQTYAPIEIVVVDDGSTDDSREVLERYGVRAIYQQNAGQAAALNAGVAAALGGIICLLDADDGWTPTKVERVVAAFAAEPSAQWLRHPLEIVDVELRRTGEFVPAIGRAGPIAPNPAALAERVITASTSAIAFRRAAAPRAFPLASAAQLRFDADALLLARLGSVCPGWQLDEPLGFYRIHDSQQYARTADVKRLLERQVDVGSQIAIALGRSEPVSNHKHRAVLAALDGRTRWPDFLRGLAACFRLVGHPLLMARQAAALLYAAAAPDVWLRKIRRQRGFSGATESEPFQPGRP